MPKSDSTAGAQYKISSFSGGGECVEVGPVERDSVAVRHSKGAEPRPVLIFSAVEWRAFVAGVKAGEFDHF